MKHHGLSKLVIFILFLGSCLSCSAQSCVDSVTTVFSGYAPNYLKNDKVWLVRRGNLGKVKDQVVDSAVINKDSSFRFIHKGKRGQVLIVSAGVSDTPVVLEQGSVHIDFNTPTIDLGGTPLNDALHQFTVGYGDILRNRGLANGAVERDSTLSAPRKTEKYDSIMHHAVSQAVSQALPVIRKYHDTELAEYAMSECLRWTGENIQLFDSLYDAMDRRAVTMPRLQQVIERMENVRLSSPGSMFRDFTVAQGNLDGTPVRLSDYVGRGKYVLLDFWASWCIWCRAEFPTLAKVYAKHKNDNFEIVGLVVDDKLKDTKAALEKEQMVVWPQIVNAGAAERELYGVEGIPEIILFDPTGRIVARGLRGERLIKTVDAVLAE